MTTRRSFISGLAAAVAAAISGIPPFAWRRSSQRPLTYPYDPSRILCRLGVRDNSIKSGKPSWRQAHKEDPANFLAAFEGQSCFQPTEIHGIWRSGDVANGRINWVHVPSMASGSCLPGQDIQIGRGVEYGSMTVGEYERLIEDGYRKICSMTEKTAA